MNSELDDLYMFCDLIDEGNTMVESILYIEEVTKPGLADFETLPGQPS